MWYRGLVADGAGVHSHLRQGAGLAAEGAQDVFKVHVARNLARATRRWDRKLGGQSPRNTKRFCSVSTRVCVPSLSHALTRGVTGGEGHRRAGARTCSRVCARSMMTRTSQVMPMIHLSAANRWWKGENSGSSISSAGISPTLSI